MVLVVIYQGNALLMSKFSICRSPIREANSRFLCVFGAFFRCLFSPSQKINVRWQNVNLKVFFPFTAKLIDWFFRLTVKSAARKQRMCMYMYMWNYMRNYMHDGPCSLPEGRYRIGEARLLWSRVALDRAYLLSTGQRTGRHLPRQVQSQRERHKLTVTKSFQ